MFTETASRQKRPLRAFILNGNSVQTNRANPIYTLSATGAPGRNIAQTESVRIVKMDIRALGRFQTVPDWYQGLTYKINGNGVPCLMAEGIMKTFLD